MSDIQRIGYHFLYNLGVKIERDKQTKPLKINSGGDQRQYAMPNGKERIYYEEDYLWLLCQFR